jgi:hypothetical protein
MRFRLILLLMLVSLGASVSQAQEAQRSSAVPFRISSLESQFSFAGTFEGEYRITPDAVEVTITKAKVYLRGNAPYRGRRELAFINVGLGGLKPSGGWAFSNLGHAIPVGRIMRPGDEYSLVDLRFKIPKEASTDWAQHWLVLELGEIALDIEDGDDEKVGYAFAHSERNIFVRYLSERREQ